MFNYIITIHNSEEHLRSVFMYLTACKAESSRIYAVIDGCTDGSKKIAENFGATILETPDIRETLAINHALKNIELADYNVIMQDDVLVRDVYFEENIRALYKAVPNLGVVSLRHGANFRPDTLTNGLHASEKDVVQNEHQNYLDNVEHLKEGFYTERQIVYKSPICLSKDVIEKLGGYDERIAPIAHDDTEYCIRAFKAGFKNVVYALPISQPLHWGGTRRFAMPSETNVRYHQEHMDLLRTLYPEEISYLQANPPSLEQIKI